LAEEDGRVHWRRKVPPEHLERKGAKTIGMSLRAITRSKGSPTVLVTVFDCIASGDGCEKGAQEATRVMETMIILSRMKKTLK
jgi:hypothetical protein